MAEIGDGDDDLQKPLAGFDAAEALLVFQAAVDESKSEPLSGAFFFPEEVGNIKS
jgi:hypothetical protein